jgi:hypothetical protein
MRTCGRGPFTEFDWQYRPVPPIPDEFASHLLMEVAQRL